jgi:hypothetical protein
MPGGAPFELTRPAGGTMPTGPVPPPARVGWFARLADSAWAAVGGQVAVGIVLGLVWLTLAPRPAAVWAGEIWLAVDDLDFSAAQDVWFAVLTGCAGVLTAVVLVAASRRPRAGRRAGLWLGGSLAGALGCLGVGLTLSGGWATPDVREAVTQAPVVLTSPGLAIFWMYVAAVVTTVGMAGRTFFGRTW